MDLIPTDPSNIDEAERTAHPPSQGQGQMDNPSRMDGEAKESTKTSLELEDECNNDPREAHVSDSRVQYFVSELDANGRRFERVQKAIERPTTPKPQETSDFAFVVKEIWDASGKDKKIEIVLIGQELRNIMQDVLGKHLEHDRRSDWAAKERTLQELKRWWPCSIFCSRRFING